MGNKLVETHVALEAVVAATGRVTAQLATEDDRTAVLQQQQQQKEGLELFVHYMKLNKSLRKAVSPKHFLENIFCIL